MQDLLWQDSYVMTEVHTHLHYEDNVTDWPLNLILGQAKLNPTI
jgi:hypothetical protein